MNHARTWIALLTLTACSLPGCEHPAPKPPQPVLVEPGMPDSRAQSTAILVDHARAFQQIVAQMPGDSGAEHRKLLVKVLGELRMVLRSANGPVESPEFMNRIKVIESAARTAGTPSITRARMEAVENQAILAGYKALNEITTRYLFDDEQLPPMLEILNKNVEVTAGVIGPMHDLDATEAFRAMQAVVQRISDDMVARFAPTETTDSNVATPPSTAP